jgi:Tfp pilus assembly protein FimV
MSAIGITTTGFAGPVAGGTRLRLTARGTRLRLTARGRRVIAALAAVPAVVALSAAIIGGSSAALATREPGAHPGSFETVTVTAGESLWSIAQEVAPSADPRDVIDAIIRLNALDGVTVSAGERLAIPAEYSQAD